LSVEVLGFEFPQKLGDFKSRVDLFDPLGINQVPVKKNVSDGDTSQKSIHRLPPEHRIRDGGKREWCISHQ
jgi:hypothetical protein